MDLMFDMCASLAYQGFDRLVIINGHGYNTFDLGVVAQRMTEEKSALCAVLDWFAMVEDVSNEICETRMEAHAGEMETSVMLYLRPDLVKMEKAVTEMNFPETKYSWIDIRKGRAPVHLEIPWIEACPETKSAVVGDPSKATVDKGRIVVERAAERIAEFVAEFRNYHRKSK
jgi:creatinine amidohydrolase